MSAPATALQQFGVVKPLLDAVRTVEVPTIAALNGHCVGGAAGTIYATDPAEHGFHQLGFAFR